MIVINTNNSSQDYFLIFVVLIHMARNRFITRDGFPFFIQKEPNYREIKKRMYFLSTAHVVSSWFVVLHLLDLLGVFSFLSFVSFSSLISHNASLSFHSHKSQFTLIPIIPGGPLFPGGPSGPLSPLGPDIYHQFLP